MFNRSTKLTALLVAAASIASSVPAMAATKLANKEGTVDRAVAYKDGKYLYEGYRTDDDEKALYFNAGDKDKKLDDADELAKVGDVTTKFDDKFVSAKNGTDNYVVDMTTGKITDDDTLEDLESTAKTKLKNKLTKTERYDNITEDDFTINPVTAGSFDDMWYSYETTSGDKFGYTNGSGTYIDCSFDMNLYVYYNATTSSTTGKMYKIDDVDDKAEVDDGVNAEIKSVKFERYLGQDDKNIYTLISANITNTMELKSATGAYDVVHPEETTHYFIQKVTKAQGDKEKDAYKPKTTECYEIGENLNNGDVKDAYSRIKSPSADQEIRVVDGALYATFTNEDGDKVKTEKIVLKNSEKLEVQGKKEANSKVSGRVAKKDGDTDTKADDWTIDVNGTVWAIYNGEIKKSVKKDSFETVYTCDRSLDAIDVYDENNLIAWDVNGDVYTTVQEGSDAAKKEAEEIVGEQPAPVAKTGWQKDATTGTWTLYDAVGTQLTGWQLVGGKYYYMDPSTGVMQTGWVKSPASGKWYYMDPVNGDMKTGWQLVGGKWYYMNPSNGDMQTGWVYDGSNWYYMYSDGSMASNTTIDGYVLNASGAWIN